MPFSETDFGMLIQIHRDSIIGSFPKFLALVEILNNRLKPSGYVKNLPKKMLRYYCITYLLISKHQIQ